MNQSRRRARTERRAAWLRRGHAVTQLTPLPRAFSVGRRRLVFAAGQAVGPYASLGLYSSVDMWAPWACLAALSLSALALYVCLGVNLFRDHEWSTTGLAVAMSVDRSSTSPRSAKSAAEDPVVLAAGQMSR